MQVLFLHIGLDTKPYLDNQLSHTLLDFARNDVIVRLLPLPYELVIVLIEFRHTLVVAIVGIVGYVVEYPVVRALHKDFPHTQCTRNEALLLLGVLRIVTVLHPRFEVDEVVLVHIRLELVEHLPSPLDFVLHRAYRIANVKVHAGSILP